MAYQFNSGYLQTLGTGLPVANANKTICCRVYMNGVSALQSFFNAVDPATSTGYQLGIVSGALSIWNYGGSPVVTGPNMLANRWYDIDYTFDGTNHNMYLDAVLQSSSTTYTPANAPTLIQLGGNQWNENLNGLLEDVRIYNRLLTSNEIVSAHSNSHDGNLAGLVAWWRMDDYPRGMTVSNCKEDISNRQHTVVGTAPIGQPTFFNGSFIRML